MAFPWLKCVSVFLVLIGAGLAIVGLVVTPKVLPKYVQQQLVDYLVIDSNTSEQYVGWSVGQDVANPFYLVLYLYNMTNADAVMNGSAPVYQTVGPYMYRRYRASTGVSFPDDGNLISYSDYTKYVYDQNASGGLMDTDIVTNINPAYIGGLMQATLPNGESSEANMLFAAIGGLVEQYIIPYFTGPFISLYTSLALPPTFTTAMNSVIEAINATTNSTEASYNTFISTWANATTAPAVGNWTGLLLATNSSAAPNISIASAEALLTPSIPLSLLNGSHAAAWTWDQALANATLGQTLMNTFNLTLAQLTLIWNWRINIFGPALLYPNLTNTYQLTNITDLGWVQWAAQTVLKSPVNTLFPEITTLGFYTKLELDNTALTWQQWKQIWNNSTGLTNITVWQEFAFYTGLNRNNPHANYSQWGLTTAEATAVEFYGLGLVGGQLKNSIPAEMGPYAGLFVSRSVFEWAFDCDDYLLNMLQEVPPLCSFKYNNSVSPPNLINSGKANLTEINTYLQWEQQAVVYGWQSPINATGHTELGQFIPGNTEHNPNAVFQEDLVRTVYLNYTGPSSVEGIDTDSYVLDFNTTFSPNPLYFQLWTGLANMTDFLDAPIFLSLWDMLYVENGTTTAIGQNPTNEFNCSTVIDIEPKTGKAVQSRKRLQVNVYVPANNSVWFGTSSIFGHQNLASGIFYPTVKIGEYGTISSDQADQLKEKLALEPRIRDGAFYAGVTAGPAFVVIGIALFILSMRRRAGYEQIGARD